ncbi:auxin-responsive protein SAUR32-like [Lotus japonicus]|uniref:auxin-responsive protein SAUR32-like n=1 Tax=Lotus japonicus TaxID=34305 RepID=UPI002589541E|nr:auxin-responsive protein SAUR32-like [Lotus japonicus]
MNFLFSADFFKASSYLLLITYLTVQLQNTFSCRKGVKQGHFVVVATEGWKPERFFIELGYLDHPDFVKLLKQAEEEFGFSQEGALAIPCEPDDLKRIIGRKKLINKGGIDITC